MAAEYVADTMHATVGPWAGHNRNRSRFGQPMSPGGRAARIDSIRGFFCDLIEWEWIKPRFDPRRVMSMPLSLCAQIGPNPRIIDDASWAKLMAAGLTLNAEDLKPYGSGRAREAGWKATYYPVEMVRAMVGVWLFGGCRVDEIRRLELDCVTWDQGPTTPPESPSPSVCCTSRRTRPPGRSTSRSTLSWASSSTWTAWATRLSKSTSADGVPRPITQWEPVPWEPDTTPSSIRIWRSTESSDSASSTPRSCRLSPVETPTHPRSRSPKRLPS